MALSLEYWQTVEPDAFFQAVAGEENRELVIRTLRALTPDPIWMEVISTWVRAGRIETRCFVAWLAAQLQPAAYLEVGVRRGFTMAMVAAQCPQAAIYGFDMWVENYANVSNPGPKFVQQELQKVGYREKIHFTNGNSHLTLPRFFGTVPVSLRAQVRDTLNGARANRPAAFDLITIDGDHSLLGAYQDLLDTMPHCALGGAVVFDDLTPDPATTDPAQLRLESGEDPHGWRDLQGVWQAVQQRFPNFRYFTYTANPPGIGVAVRLA